MKPFKEFSQICVALSDFSDIMLWVDLCSHLINFRDIDMVLLLYSRTQVISFQIWLYCTNAHTISCLIIHSSEIYCTGPILQQVQKAKLFDDDKYFVDMKLREAPGKSKSVHDLCLDKSIMWLLLLVLLFSCRCCFVGFSQSLAWISKHDHPVCQTARVRQCILWGTGNRIWVMDTTRLARRVSCSIWRLLLSHTVFLYSVKLTGVNFYMQAKVPG